MLQTSLIVLGDIHKLLSSTDSQMQPPLSLLVQNLHSLLLVVVHQRKWAVNLLALPIQFFEGWIQNKNIVLVNLCIPENQILQKLMLILILFYSKDFEIFSSQNWYLFATLMLPTKDIFAGQDKNQQTKKHKVKFFLKKLYCKHIHTV